MAPIRLVIAEAIAMRLARPEDLLGRDGRDDLGPRLELRIESAVHEVAQALVATGRGRPLSRASSQRSPGAPTTAMVSVET